MFPTLQEFIKSSPTAFHAVSTAKDILKANGFIEIFEHEAWNIKHGSKYFVTRNGSSLIAFGIPQDAPKSFMIAASHSDSPSFKLKENHALNDGVYSKLSTEKYGGMLCSTWLDKPLSVAGRIVVSDENALICSKLVNYENVALIPNVAIHFNRTANEQASFNAAVDMVPVVSSKLDEMLKESVGKDNLLSKDLYLYNPQEPCVWGDYVSAPRLDDLQCAYATLKALTEATAKDGVCPVYALFDNEEVGSTTKQGAASTFLYDVLTRISASLGVDYSQTLATSFMLSCDNAHAKHPNHPEYTDKNNEVFMNKGIVIKHNANQKYTSDAISTAIFKAICDSVSVPYQSYANRSDLPGGSTLGNISAAKVSVNAVDIGLAQLAMHSSYETAGVKDTEYMCSAVKYFFEHYISTDGQKFSIKQK